MCVCILRSVSFTSVFLLYNSYDLASNHFYRHKKSYSTSNLLNISTFLVLNSFMLRPSHTSIVCCPQRTSIPRTANLQHRMYASIGQACASLLQIIYVKVSTGAHTFAHFRLPLCWFAYSFVYDDGFYTSRLDTNLCEYHARRYGTYGLVVIKMTRR